MATAKVALGTVTSIAAIAGLLYAVSEEEVVADCVMVTAETDGTYRIMDDTYCDSHAAYVRWVYGGTRTGVYVRGGTAVRPSGNVSITSRSGRVISRGGFGGRGTGGGG
ncbi:hypothetical protein ABT158_48625 [Nonomuraea sp. NPDC001636]|uniref:hypothetical protein n=1 Tax=Nonomuraea sp. NPDC001636 TaxID=3154391 RepID=UPI00332861A4